MNHLVIQSPIRPKQGLDVKSIVSENIVSENIVSETITSNTLESKDKTIVGSEASQAPVYDLTVGSSQQQGIGFISPEKYIWWSCYNDSGTIKNITNNYGAFLGFNSQGELSFYTSPSIQTPGNNTGTELRATISKEGDIYIGDKKSSIPSNSTNRFFRVSNIAGTPTGIVPTVSGCTPVTIDQKSRLWLYDSIWKESVPAGGCYGKIVFNHNTFASYPVVLAANPNWTIVSTINSGPAYQKFKGYLSLGSNGISVNETAWYKIIANLSFDVPAAGMFEFTTGNNLVPNQAVAVITAPASNSYHLCLTDIMNLSAGQNIVILLRPSVGTPTATICGWSLIIEYLSNS